MKTRIAVFPILIALFSSSAFAQHGTGNGGGGEILFSTLTAKISTWLKNNHQQGSLAQKLHLEDGNVSENELLEAYGRAAKSTPDVKFIPEKDLTGECTKGDAGACLLADNLTRICMNHTNPNFIRCNDDLFNKSSGDLQFAITFHEYLGIAGIESNGGSTSANYSRYPISKWIMNFAAPNTVRYDLLMEDQSQGHLPGVPVNNPTLFQSIRDKYNGRWPEGDESGKPGASYVDGSYIFELTGKAAELMFYDLANAQEEIQYIPSIEDPKFNQGRPQCQDNHFTRKGNGVTCSLFSNDLKNDPFARFVCRWKIDSKFNAVAAPNDYQQAVLPIDDKGPLAQVVTVWGNDEKYSEWKFNVQINGNVAGHIYESMPYPEISRPSPCPMNFDPQTDNSILYPEGCGTDHYKAAPTFFCNRTENKDPNGYSCQFRLKANGDIFTEESK
jgi:hypothetical protein